MADKMQIANAPCSWGALEFDLDGKAPGYEQVLNEIRDTGYEGTELGDWGFMPTDPAALHAAIADRKLQLLGAFVPVALANEGSHGEGIRKVLQTAGLMYEAGYKDAFIVLADENGSVPERTRRAGRISTSDALQPAQMKTFAAGAEKLAHALRDKYGMKMVFHHHCAGYIETPAEIEALLAATSPDLLGICFDTGHFLFGGGSNPAAFMEKHWERIWHLHFKDFATGVADEAAKNDWDYFESVRHGVFCELGKGAVDFPAIKHLLDRKGYKGWIVVEQDVLPGMGAPKKCAADNRRYLQEIGL